MAVAAATVVGGSLSVACPTATAMLVVAVVLLTVTLHGSSQMLRLTAEAVAMTTAGAGRVAPPTTTTVATTAVAMTTAGARATVTTRELSCQEKHVFSHASPSLAPTRGRRRKGAITSTSRTCVAVARAYRARACHACSCHAHSGRRAGGSACRNHVDMDNVHRTLN